MKLYKTILKLKIRRNWEKRKDHDRWKGKVYYNFFTCRQSSKKSTKGYCKRNVASLCKKYEEKDVHGINSARKKYFNSKQENKESIKEFLDRVNTMRDELEAASCEISDEDKMTIVQEIKPEYEIVVQCLTVNKKVKDLELDDISNELVLEEMRTKIITETKKAKYSTIKRRKLG